MSLKIYQLLTIIFSPLIDLYLLVRLLRGKEDKKRFKERLGYTDIKRPEGKIIWFQCASVGESNSALPLIEKIIEKYDEKITVLITTGTITSSEIIGKKILGKSNIIHQYTPVDKYFVIKRFIKHWKPSALITVESEIWPNMITLAHQNTDKVMIVNAKISEKSFKRWKKFKGMKESVFDSIDVCYPQSQDDQYRLINLGIQNTVFLGNLKFDIPRLKVNEQFLNKIRDSIRGRKMLLCASIHDGEEKIIGRLYNRLKNDFPSIIFIVALRHTGTSKKISEYLMSQDLVVKRKSMNEVIDFSTNIYLYDEMGEMGTLYEASDIVLMCGSLIDNIGGHTPVEPAKHMCAIITGPYIKNNKSLFVELEKDNACIISDGRDSELEDNLYDNVYSLMNSDERVNELKQNAFAVCEKFSNVSNEVAKNIIVNLK